MARELTLRDGVDAMKIAVGLAVVVAIGVATLIGYRIYKRDYDVTVDHNGTATAQVVAATLYARSDLRVSRLSGTVQGTARAARLWGWLPSSQVVKAPFSVDYFVPMGGLRLSDFDYDDRRRLLTVTVPDPAADRPNVDLARTTLNDVTGAFVTRGAMTEMAGKVAASASGAAAERAGSAENMAKAREFARDDIARLFTGALRAARLDADVRVRFASEPSRSTEQWDRSRSLQEVLGNAR